MTYSEIPEEARKRIEKDTIKEMKLGKPPIYGGMFTGTDYELRLFQVLILTAYQKEQLEKRTRALGDAEWESRLWKDVARKLNSQLTAVNKQLDQYREAVEKAEEQKETTKQELIELLRSLTEGKTE